MSISRPFFNANLPKAKSFQPLDDKEFKKLHWTRQLELRPLRTQKRWAYNTDGDYNSLIDNWDDPEGE